MKKKPALRCTAALSLALLCPATQANMSLQFNDSGAWTATRQADALHPFSGQPPQLSLDGSQDIGAAGATEFGYGGQATTLAHWHAGDSQGSDFVSGALSRQSSFGSDKQLNEARVASHVPEPSSVLLTAMALALAGLTGTSLSLMRRRPKPQES